MEKTDDMSSSIVDENNETAVAQFVLDRFQRHVIVLKKLPSFGDNNILLQSKPCGSSSDPPKFVLKVISGSGLNEKKIQCVNLLKSQKFLCSEFIPGLDGNYQQTFSENDVFGKRFAVLYSFLDGKELEHTGFAQYPVVISELGSFLAHFHKVLKDIPWKEDLVPDPKDPWNVNNYKLLCGEICIDVVENEPRRQMLSSIMEYVVETLEAAQDSFTRGILHGDVHGLNIIVSESYNPFVRSSYNLFVERHIRHETDSTEKKILTSNEINNLGSSSLENFESLLTLIEKMKCDEKKCFSSKDLLDVYGIIDFDSITYSYTVLEVGRLIADVMVVYVVQSKTDARCTVSELSETRLNHGDAIASLSESSMDHLCKIGGYVLGGYLLSCSLTLPEVNCVYPAMLSSLCQYYLLGARAALDEPDSEDYLAYCSSEAILLLEFFNGLNVQNTVQIWRKAAEEILHSAL